MLNCGKYSHPEIRLGLNNAKMYNIPLVSTGIAERKPDIKIPNKDETSTAVKI